jgi:hypothetical protein
MNIYKSTRSANCARRDGLVGVRLKDFERLLLKNYAKSLGMNSSDYLRSLLGFPTIGRKFRYPVKR